MALYIGAEAFTLCPSSIFLIQSLFTSRKIMAGHNGKKAFMQKRTILGNTWNKYWKDYQQREFYYFNITAAGIYPATCTFPVKGSLKVQHTACVRGD